MAALHEPLPVDLRSLLPDALHGLCEQRRYVRGALLFQTGRRPGSMHFVSNGEVVLQRVHLAGDRLEPLELAAFAGAEDLVEQRHEGNVLVGQRAGGQPASAGTTPAPGSW